MRVVVRSRNRPSFFIFAIVLMTSLGCTRKIEKQGLQLMIGVKSSKAGAMSVTGNLEMAVVNVHLPTGPLVREFKFHNNPPPAGQPVALEIPSVPQGNFLVQFLGVYRNEAQPSTIVYDDALVNVAGPQTEVTLYANEVGTFTKEGRVAGRYISTVGPPENGPTGQLVMQYQPPNGVPKMNIEKFSMVDGWFNVMALDGMAVDYALEGTNEVIFPQLSLVGSNLVINGSSVPTSLGLAKFSVPQHYRQVGPTQAKGFAPMEIYLGYIIKPGLAGVASKEVCFANDISEGSTYFSDSALNNRLDIVTTANIASAITHVAGGTGDFQENVYTGDVGTCNSATGPNLLTVNHSLLTDDGGFSGGIVAPFVATKPFSRRDNFITSQFSSAPSPQISLKWDYLPGVASLNGVTVYAKNFSTGSSDDDLRSCDEILGKGFIEAGSAVFPLETFTFTGMGLTAANKASWGFVLCPYKMVAGQKRWVGHFVGGGGIADVSAHHLGWAPASATHTGITTETYIGRGGAITDVLDVDAVSNPSYTTLSVNNVNIFAADEVVVTIVGRGVGATDCGVYNGEPNEVGLSTFARVLWGGSSTATLRVPKGTFIDSLHLVDFSNPATAGTNFCKVNVSKVLHYRNLNLASTTNFGSGFTAFNFANQAGVFALRVNGLLTLGSTSISASGKGYMGGSTGTIHGAGRGGVKNSSASTFSGGTGSSSAGGGGGGILQGHTGTSSGGAGGSGVSSFMNNYFRLVMGGGGGAGFAGTSIGGDGGGSIFIAARDINLVGSVTIQSNGTPGGSASAGGGGGAGGSVTLIAGTLSRTLTQTLTLQSSGGNGGTGTSTGGGGAGGTAVGLICNLSFTNTAVTATALAGIGGVGGSHGFSLIQSDPSGPLCHNE